MPLINPDAERDAALGITGGPSLPTPSTRGAWRVLVVGFVGIACLVSAFVTGYAFSPSSDIAETVVAEAARSLNYTPSPGCRFETVVRPVPEAVPAETIGLLEAQLRSFGYQDLRVEHFELEGEHYLYAQAAVC